MSRNSHDRILAVTDLAASVYASMALTLFLSGVAYSAPTFSEEGALSEETAQHTRSEKGYKYFGLGGGYNSKSGEPLGTVSAGIHFGDSRDASLGVHHHKENHSTSYGVDIQGYRMMATGTPLALMGGIVVGHTYHDEPFVENGGYLGAKAGVMWRPSVFRGAILTAGYTYKKALGSNPDVDHINIGYRVIF